MAWLASSPLYPQLDINSSDITLGARLMLPVMESATTTCPVYDGTGSPEAKVTAPVCSIYLRSDGSTNATLYVKESGVGSSGWVASDTGAWRLSGNSLYSNITSYVGIGTTSPYSRLTVWGPDTGSTTAFSVVNNASTTAFAVYDNGNATCSGSIFQSFDQRLKTNIQSLDASSSLLLIERLDPVTFNWIDPDKGRAPQLGFIAQQVQAIFPDLISTTSASALTPDGTLTLNCIGLIAPIVAAVQHFDQMLADFAQHFTTTELTFERATGDDIATTHMHTQDMHAQELCLGSTCVTEDQLKTLLSQAGQHTTPASVPSDMPAISNDQATTTISNAASILPDAATSSSQQSTQDATTTTP